MAGTAGTVVFVHGTGVREEGFNRNLMAIREGLAGAGLHGFEVIGVPGGEKRGIETDKIELTLPEESRTRALSEEPATEDEIEAMRWRMLAEDPLWELRLAADGKLEGVAAKPSFAINQELPEERAAAALRGLREKMGEIAPTASLPAIEFAAMGLSAQELAAAADRVARSSELRAAAQGMGDGADPDLLEAASWAIVAEALAQHRGKGEGEAPRVMYDGAMRKGLVEAIAARLIPGTRSLLGKLKNKVLRFLERPILIDRRARLSTGTLPAIGDILFYQRRGEAIREFVRDFLRPDLMHPIVAFGHSLGGIVLVDLLSEAEPPAVDLLVTVGSQSPLLFAIDSLGSLRPAARGGVGSNERPFTPWLNVYNPFDTLSYVAARIFPQAAAGIRDESIDPGVPFPEAHSAYFFSKRTYELLAEELAKLSTT